MDQLTVSERQSLDEDGYLALECVVESKRVKAMRTRLQELLAITQQDHAGTLIVGGLLEEEVFDAAWLQPRVLAAARHVLGDQFRLTGMWARGLRRSRRARRVVGLSRDLRAGRLHEREWRHPCRTWIASQPLDAENPRRPKNAAPSTAAAHWRSGNSFHSQHPLRPFCSPQCIGRTAVGDIRELFSSRFAAALS